MMIFWSIIFLIKIEAYASFNRQNQEEIDRIGKGNFFYISNYVRNHLEFE